MNRNERFNATGHIAIGIVPDLMPANLTVQPHRTTHANQLSRNYVT